MRQPLHSLPKAPSVRGRVAGTLSWRRAGIERGDSGVDEVPARTIRTRAGGRSCPKLPHTRRWQQLRDVPRFEQVVPNEEPRFRHLKPRARVWRVDETREPGKIQEVPCAV